MGQPKNAGILRTQTNWENLYFYQKTVALYQLTYVFCKRFLPNTVIGRSIRWCRRRGAASRISWKAVPMA